MTFRPGSALWLMRHELRLYLRAGAFRGASVAFLILLEVLLHLVAVPLAFVLRKQPLPDGVAVLMVTGGLALVSLLMVSRSLFSVVEALYTRGDMDLLLSSPLAPNSIIGTRAAAIAATLTLEFAVLIWPFANVFVLMGMFAWSKAYVLLPALAMLATCCGLLLALGMFRVLGPRRTRLFAQIMAAVIGAGFVLLGQLPNIMRGTSHQLSANAGFTALKPDAGLIWAPARLILDGALPTLLIALCCAAALVLTVRTMGMRFINASTASAGVGAARVRVSNKNLRFRSAARSILVLKELRLIGRDPLLLTQLLQQSIYILPMSLMLWRQQAGGTPWMWLTIIFLVGTLASSLAWLTIAAEDVPDLLATAPLSRVAIVRAKTQAALLPLVPLMLLPLLVLWRGHAAFGAAVTVCSAGCAISLALLNIRNPVARRRGDFKTRHKGAPGSGVIEVGVILVWILLCASTVWLTHR